MLGLENRVVLVTGGNRGIGAAIVKRLSDAGAVVGYVNRSGAGTYGALQIDADVTDGPALDAAIERVEGDLGPIYGVVANAGITRDAVFHKMTEQQWDEVMDVNLKGVFRTLRPVLPRMYGRKEGAVVSISSIVGERGNIGQVNYSASKAALIGLTKSLAREGARHNVRVNAVAPGFIDTSMLEAVPQDIRARIVSEIPAGRFGTPDDIAYAVAYLLSPVMSGFVTGEVLRVNGGHHT